MKYLKPEWIFVALVFLISPLAIGTFWLRSVTYPLLWILIPFLVYEILPPRKTRMVKALVFLVVACYYLISGWKVLGFLICGYGPAQVEWVNRENPDIKIVGRDFSCYGTTGDLVLYTEYPLTKNIHIDIHYKTFIDYKNISIDTLAWKKTGPY